MSIKQPPVLFTEPVTVKPTIGALVWSQSANVQLPVVRIVDDTGQLTPAGKTYFAGTFNTQNIPPNSFVEPQTGSLTRDAGVWVTNQLVQLNYQNSVPTAQQQAQTAEVVEVNQSQKVY
jgi:hypothetical protein